MPALIYVIAAGDSALKIGVSEAPTDRMVALQIGSASALSLAFVGSCGKHARTIERRVHRALSEHKERGEWFRVLLPAAIDGIREAARQVGARLEDVTAAHMGKELVPLLAPGQIEPAVTGEIEATFAQARTATADFIAASRAANTRRGYSADWRDFEEWCRVNGLQSLPASPEAVGVYLSSLTSRGRKTSTIRRRMAGIAYFHTVAQHPNPCAHVGVRSTISGIARTLGVARTKKAALTAPLVAKLVRKIPSDLAGLRDRALILVGFAAALRRSELVALDLEDITRDQRGIVVTVRRSKTDQAGVGHRKAIPHGRKLHVVAALDAWLAAAKITSGAIFRGVRGTSVLAGRLCDRQVARAVKRRARAAGLDPRAFSGHSLRSGFITTAADHDAPLAAIAAHAGHAKLDTTRGYIQVADAFRHHSGKDFL